MNDREGIDGVSVVEAPSNQQIIDFAEPYSVRVGHGRLFADHGHLLNFARALLARGVEVAPAPDAVEALKAALPVLQDYASSNPMHFYRGAWQDPRGVHAAVKLVTAALGVQEVVPTQPQRPTRSELPAMFEADYTSDEDVGRKAGCCSPCIDYRECVESMCCKLNLSPLTKIAPDTDGVEGMSGDSHG